MTRDDGAKVEPVTSLVVLADVISMLVEVVMLDKVAAPVLSTATLTTLLCPGTVGSIVVVIV